MLWCKYSTDARYIRFTEDLSPLLAMNYNDTLYQRQTSYFCFLSFCFNRERKSTRKKIYLVVKHVAHSRKSKRSLTLKNHLTSYGEHWWLSMTSRKCGWLDLSWNWMQKRLRKRLLKHWISIYRWIGRFGVEPHCKSEGNCKVFIMKISFHSYSKQNCFSFEKLCT